MCQLILFLSEETWWSFTRNLYLTLLNVSTCKFQTFVTFVITDQKRELDVILMYNSGFHLNEFCAFWNLKSTSVKHIIYILCIKMTTYSLFWSWESQNIEICHLKRSIISNMNCLQNFTVFLHLWKNCDKISHHWCWFVIFYHCCILQTFAVIISSIVHLSKYK